jgi:hypothetical protein
VKFIKAQSLSIMVRMCKNLAFGAHLVFGGC